MSFLGEHRDCGKEASATSGSVDGVLLDEFRSYDRSFDRVSYLSIPKLS